MAMCTQCRASMQQTEALCPACGFDFAEPDESWRVLFLRKSSLRDLFRLMTVIMVPLAITSYFLPALRVAANSRSPFDGFFAFFLGVCLYYCGGAIQDSSPVSARLFNSAAIVLLAVWPILLF